MANKETEKVQKMAGKIEILRDIYTAKDMLFGPFSYERTAQMKSKIWTDILNKAKSLGLVASCRSHKYMRNIYWQNIKRHSLYKRKNAQKLGKEFLSTPIDELVYQIVDNTSTLHQQYQSDHEPNILSPQKKPVSLKQAMLTPKPDLDFELINEAENGDNEDFVIEKVDYLADEYSYEQSQQIPSDGDPTQPNYEVLSDAPPFAANGHKNSFEYKRVKKVVKEVNLSKRKAQLEIDFLELKKYKTQLEVLDLETKLGMKPSRFTSELAKRQKKTNQVLVNDDSEDSDFTVD